MDFNSGLFYQKKFRNLKVKITVDFLLKNDAETFPQDYSAPLPKRLRSMNVQANAYTL